MKKKECPSCAMDVPVRDKVCPICGYEFAQQNAVARWVAVALVILIIISLLLSL